MAVKPGYKLTHLGVLPEEWKVLEIGDLNPFVTSGSRGWAAFYSNRGSPFIRITNLSRECIYLDLRDLRFVSLIEETSEGIRTQLQDQDILISITADIGIIGYVTHALQKPAYINQHIALVRFDPSKVGNKFIAYFLSSENPQKLFNAMTDQGAKAGMSLITVRKLFLALPPLPEQHAIAAALSDVDALLAALDALIAKKHLIKQGAMQELLTGQRRLPGFSGEWEEKSLYELVENKKELFDDGDWIEAPYLTGSGVRLIQTGNIGVGNFVDREVKKYISHESFKNLRCKELKPGDILICRLAEPAGRACILPEIAEDKIITAVDVSIFRPLDTVADRRYLVNIFSTKQWFDEIDERCGGTTRSRIARSELGKIKLFLPPLSEQTAIAKILSDMDAEIQALEQRRQKTRLLKRGMMQELLTGRIRLV
ncbi:MAG: restriction endonuclease subunit S [Chloroflexi bacterium]|nr:restriction endonuclease subunit S [Chloroflexota bacterium]